MKEVKLVLALLLLITIASASAAPVFLSYSPQSGGYLKASESDNFTAEISSSSLSDVRFFYKRRGLNTFSSKLMDCTGHENYSCSVSIDLAGLLLDGEVLNYYYKARGGGNTFLGTSNDPFNLTIDKIDPTEIFLISPENNSVTSDTAPLLNWTQTQEDHFKEYAVLMSDHINFTHINYTYSTYNINSTSYQITEPLAPNVNYYWKVIAHDLAERTSETPTYIYILDTAGPVIDILHPVHNGYSSGTFRYLPKDNTLYKCSLYGDFNGTYELIEEDLAPQNLNTNSFALSADEGTYNWSIKCSDLLNNTSQTPNYTANIDNTDPSEFDLISPENNLRSDNFMPLLNWTQTHEDHFKEYTVLMSDQSDFSHINFTYTISGINSTYYQLTEPLAPNVNYYWKVIAHDLAERTSESPTYVYITDTLPPVLSDLSASGTEGNVVLSLITDEPATCKYDSNNITYSNMSQTFETTTELSHKQNLKLNEGSYTYFVACQDPLGYTSGTESIEFDVSVPKVTTSSSDGGSSASRVTEGVVVKEKPKSSSESSQSDTDGYHITEEESETASISSESLTNKITGHSIYIGSIKKQKSTIVLIIGLSILLLAYFTVIRPSPPPETSKYSGKYVIIKVKK